MPKWSKAKAFTDAQLVATTIICRRCGKELPKIEEYFPINKGSKQYKERGICVHNTICRKCAHLIEYGAFSEDPMLRIGKIVRSLRFKAKKKNIPWDIDSYYVYEIFYNQKGKCAITGIDLTLKTNEYKVILPTAFSVDRIDPKKGYIKGNIQVVSFWANTAKSTLSLEELKTYCKTLIDYQTKQICP